MFLLFVFVYNVNSSKAKSIQSQKHIYERVARQLNVKDPNKLTDEDFENIQEVMIGLNEIATVKTLLKLKNLKRIEFIYYQDPGLNMNLDLGTLAKLQKLRVIKFTTVELSSGFIKAKWYEKVFPSLIRLRYRIKPFDLGTLRKLKQIESLSISHEKIRNIMALASLGNLKELALSKTKLSPKQREKLQKALPGLNIH